MNSNMDMSEIIEFVLPSKTEYLDQDNDDGGDEDEDNDVNNQFVVLDAVDVGHDYRSEEFLLVKEEGSESEMIIENTQLINDSELQEAMQLTKDDSQYMLDDQDLSEEFPDQVEEEVDEEFVEEEEQYEEQYEPDEDGLELQQQEQQQERQYDWNYLQASSPESTSEAINIETSLPSPAERKTKSQPATLSLVRYVTHAIVDDGDDFEEEVDTSTAALLPSEEPVQLALPSDKMMDMFKGPRRYMLFDELIATIVDFDEDGTPIVEFSMMGSTQDEKLPVECGICPDVMHKSKLSKHQKTHLVPGTNRYACIYCTETYRDCKYLAGHARRHMGIRPYVCEPCKLYFSTKQDLRVHNQRRHLEKEHICEMCGKTFAQNTQLKRHREATHEKKRRFQCQYCQKAYYKNFSLQEHIRNVHMGKRRMLKCPFCGMQCRDAHKMARHRKEMHLNQDTYVCHLCQEEFTDINYFDAHKRSIQCRSNTRRLVPEDEANTDGQFVTARDDLPSMLEEDYDEDAGLLVESTEALEAAPKASAETIYETVNGNYLHEAVRDEEQFVQQFEQNHFDDESLLVEQVPEEEDAAEQLLGEDEQYLQSIEQIEQPNFQPAQHTQQFQQQLGQEYNDDELIYEITLETEDD